MWMDGFLPRQRQESEQPSGGIARKKMKQAAYARQPAFVSG